MHTIGKLLNLHSSDKLLNYAGESLYSRVIHTEVFRNDVIIKSIILNGRERACMRTEEYGEMLIVELLNIGAGDYGYIFFLFLPLLW